MTTHDEIFAIAYNILERRNGSKAGDIVPCFLANPSRCGVWRLLCAVKHGGTFQKETPLINFNLPGEYQDFWQYLQFNNRIIDD